MKYIILFFILGISPLLYAQIYVQDFEANFDEMILVDNDNNAPNIIVQNFDNAWTVTDDEQLTNGTNVAISNSWYSPRGIADDWMITPSIKIPNKNIVLNWQARAFNMDFRDGYQVLVSTTGTEITDFKDVIFEIDHEMVEWTERFIALQDYNGQTIHIAFRNNSNDMVLLGIDNIIVKEIQGNSAKINSITTYRFHEINKAITIDGTFVNTGANDISTIEIQYEIDGQKYLKELKGLQVPYGKSYAFSITLDISISAFKDYHIIFSTNKPNGVVDPTGQDLTYDFLITPVSEIPKRMMLAEESTSTKCGACPEGHVWMDYMKNTYPDDFIGISIHLNENDPMNVSPYSDALENKAGFKRAPQVLINRKQFFNVTDMELMRTDVINEITPIGFSEKTNVVIHEENQTAQIKFTAQSFANLEDIDYRFNVVLVEDKVSSSSEAYNQANSFSGHKPVLEGAGRNWFSASDPVPASKIKYNQVARSILGGWNGYVNSIPKQLSNGQEITKSYIGYISSEWNRANMSAIIMIINNENGEILNAKKVSIAKTVGVSNSINPISNIRIFPNPTSELIHIHPAFPNPMDIQVELLDINGRILHKESFNHVTHETITLSPSTLNSGLYFVRVLNGVDVGVFKVIVK